MSVVVGYYGKIPSRGDFLRYGLPEATITVLDGWIARNLFVRKERLGDDFDLIWERAPIWRFSLEPGRLHPHCATSGLWIPSIDKAGRTFPLVLLVLHPDGIGAEQYLDALAPIALETIRDDAPPDLLQDAIAGITRAQPLAAGQAPRNQWRRPAVHDGSPILLHATLPEGEGFDMLLELLPEETDPQPPETSGA